MRGAFLSSLQGFAPNDADLLDVSEGCFWYTEEQVDEMLNKMMKDMQEEALNAPERRGQLHLERMIRMIEELLDSSDHKRKLDNFKSYPDRKWHNPIFYKFDGSHCKSLFDILA